MAGGDLRERPENRTASALAMLRRFSRSSFSGVFQPNACSCSAMRLARAFAKLMRFIPDMDVSRRCIAT